MKFKLYFKPTNDPMIYWGPVVFALSMQGFLAYPTYKTDIEGNYMTKIIETNAPSVNVFTIIMDQPFINRERTLKSLDEFKEESDGKNNL